MVLFASFYVYRFSRTPTCEVVTDTDRQTHGHGIYCVKLSSHSNNGVESDVYDCLVVILISQQLWPAHAK